MIDVTDASALMREIVAGESERDKALRDYRKLLAQYVRDIVDSEWRESLTFEYVSYMVPRICMDNPRVTVFDRKRIASSVAQAAKQAIAESVASGLMFPEAAKGFLDLIDSRANAISADEFALNCLAQDPDYGAVLDRVCYDHLMGFGVAHERIGPSPTNPELRTTITGRVSPVRFCVDPACLHHTEAQWMAHWSPFAIEDLKAKAKAGGGWKQDEIEALTPQAPAGKDVDRKEVKVWECWVPGYSEPGWPGSDEGYNGGLFTLATKRNEDASLRGGVMIRDPRPAFTSRFGPYSVFGVYVRPDSPYPMSPLLATFESQDELQKHSRAMSLNAAQYKRIVLVSDANPRLAQQIKSAGDHFVISVKDEQFDKNKVVVIEIAGVSEQQMKHYEMFKARWDRAIGVDDQQRGKVSSDTATAVAVADDAASTRVSYIQKKFAVGVQRNLMAKLHNLRYDPDIEIELGPEYADEVFKATGKAIAAPVYRGGPHEDDDSIPDDLTIEVDAYSMERANMSSLQQNLMSAMEMLFQVAPTMSQMPWMEWRDILQQIGDVFNLPGFADMVNYDMIQGMAQAAMLNGTGPGQEMSPDGLARKQAEDDSAAQSKGLMEQHASKAALMDRKHGQDMRKEGFRQDARMKQISAQAGARSKAKR